MNSRKRRWISGKRGSVTSRENVSRGRQDRRPKSAQQRIVHETASPANAWCSSGASRRHHITVSHSRRWRYHQLAKFLNLPGLRQRLAIQPREEKLDVKLPVMTVDIGYASFDVGGGEPLSMEATGSYRTALRLKNDEIEMLILSPVSPADSAATLPSASAGANPLAGRIQQLINDPISEEEAVERTQELPFLRLCG